MADVRPLHIVGDSFASQLRQKRIADALTQAQLGALLGVRQQTVAAWERGDRPKYEKISVLAEYLGYTEVRELVRLLDEAEAANERQPATDGAVMRELAQSWIALQRSRGSRGVTPAEADVYRTLADFFARRLEAAFVDNSDD